MSIHDKVIHSERFSGAGDFIYGLNLIHVDANGTYGGFLTLEMRLCDRTDTATQSVQVINTVFEKDIDEIIAAFQGIKESVAKQQKAIEAFNRAKKALAV